MQPDVGPRIVCMDGRSRQGGLAVHKQDRPARQVGFEVRGEFFECILAASAGDDGGQVPLEPHFQKELREAFAEAGLLLPPIATAFDI